tara:strand:+ start:255 stop:1424 length:1170 start_codon:yes stop_codon:yes gene_type:complete
MAEKLPWGSNFTTKHLVINERDDIFKDFPFLKLKKNGLSMKSLKSLVAPEENMVRGITKLVKQKSVGLKGSLKYGWDRTSWPIPFLQIGKELIIFDRRHTLDTCLRLADEYANITKVPTAEYERVNSEIGGVINDFTNQSILMMAAMWGNVYGPQSDDTRDHQFEGAAVNILKREAKLLNRELHSLYTKDVIERVLQFMGVYDRYPDDKRTLTRIINNVLHALNDVSTVKGTPTINNNIEDFENFILTSPDWLETNKEDDDTVYRTYKISNNEYHITDVVRRLMLTVCEKENKAVEKRKLPKKVKVILYNEKQSNKAPDIVKSRDNFVSEYNKVFNTIRDNVLLPVEDILQKERIPRKSISDFNLEVWCMNQLENEPEPYELILDKEEG